MLSWQLDADRHESDPQLAAIRKVRNYSYMEIVNINKDKLPGYEQKIKAFYEEHIHSDEEIRYVLDGKGEPNTHALLGKQSSDVPWLSHSYDTVQVATRCNPMLVIIVGLHLDGCDTAAMCNALLAQQQPFAPAPLLQATSMFVMRRTTGSGSRPVRVI